MRKPKYYKLKEQYPEYISLEQLSKICKIAKRSAKYLLDQGIIPCQDTGKSTWRYKIALEDVITYLRRREQVGSMIPCGVVISQKSNKEQILNSRRCFAQLVTPRQKTEIADYFKFIYNECDDILTTADIVEMTGLEKSTILKWLGAGYIKHIEKTPKYIVPKQYLMEFVVTRKFIEHRTSSEHFKKIIEGFEIWRNAKL
ncbi:MAG: helix-turn-helix domain-containing protein [Defluviitaleaceae bacterium]|nr:helix-turn-helix domain-containing protein [Defluviitaleaceae bacterium]